jgi:hypothetical protein
MYNFWWHEPFNQKLTFGFIHETPQVLQAVLFKFTITETKMKEKIKITLPAAPVQENCDTTLPFTVIVLVKTREFEQHRIINDNISKANRR